MENITQNTHTIQRDIWDRKRPLKEEMYAVHLSKILAFFSSTVLAFWEPSFFDREKVIEPM
jgi:hypothetical protein